MYEYSIGIPAGQEKASDPTTDGCHPPSGFLGIELRTSVGAASALTR